MVKKTFGSCDGGWNLGVQFEESWKSVNFRCSGNPALLVERFIRLKNIGHLVSKTSFYEGLGVYDGARKIKVWLDT